MIDKIKQALAVLKSDHSNPLIVNDMVGILEREFTQMIDSLEVANNTIEEFEIEIDEYKESNFTLSNANENLKNKLVVSEARVNGFIDSVIVILKGIDKIITEGGWWGMSSGAKFGVSILNEIKLLKQP